ncbi:hypothetical protein [Adhaeribacter arboris]|uniref:hypothetical protein n=1 Tax=Adhaeribacter arboris TaxID=2072846 RepID=UPI0011B1D0E6|nr:hypothetical protein [Adhaeribacter arboris]
MNNLVFTPDKPRVKSRCYFHKDWLHTSPYKVFIKIPMQVTVTGIPSGTYLKRNKALSEKLIGKTRKKLNLATRFKKL